MITNTKLFHPTKLLASRNKISLLSTHIRDRFTKETASLSIYNHHQNHQHQVNYSSSAPSQHATAIRDKDIPKKELMFSYDYKPLLEPYVDPYMSYAYGRSNHELKYSTFGKQLDELARREPHSTAIISYEEGISKNYGQFISDINCVMKGLVEKLNLKRGDPVGIYSYNNYQWLLVQFACVKLGLIVHPINPSYKAPELSYVMGKSNVKVLFTSGKNSQQSAINNHWNILQEPMMKDCQERNVLSNLSDIVVFDGETSNDFALNNITQHKWSTIYNNDGNLNSNAKIEEMINNVQSDDIYGIYYTSGTTGFPKGAIVSQFTVINNVNLTYGRLFERGPNNWMRPNICLPLPLFHQFAGVVGILCPIVKSGSIVLTGMKYNIQTMVKAIVKFQCNVVFLTPTILIDLLGYIEMNNIKNLPLRRMLVAGSPVMAELFHKVQKGIPELEDIVIGYGSSENGCIVSIQTVNEPRETKPYTVGPPLDFTEIKITDPNTGEITKLGQSGEVHTRGFNKMIGYHKDPERTKEVLTTSGWYKTADLGIIDAQGRLQIVGRIKDMIIKGGENVYPAEVEHILHGHTDIEDAHVCGVPDKRYGEEVCAWIKLKQTSRETEETKKEIINFCKKRLTYFKIPKHILFVREFPMTPVKKVKKFEMRAQSIKLLNL